MRSPLVIDGDVLQFEPQFGTRLVTLDVTPARIAASGRATVDGKRVCIVGDEAKVLLSASYSTPTHSIVGTGTVTISALAADQVADNCHNALPLITQGSKFTALFTPVIPAQQPGTPPTPDSAPPSTGSGQFVVQQKTCTAGSA